MQRVVFENANFKISMRPNHPCLLVRVFGLVLVMLANPLVSSI